MVQRVFCFVVVLLLYFNEGIFAQNISSEIGSVTRAGISIADDSSYNHSYVKNYTYNFIIREKKMVYSLNRQMNYTLLRPVSLNFYSQNFSFFCKQELKLEKTTSIAFRFRLGSLDYVNYLEQKPNAVKPRNF